MSGFIANELSALLRWAGNRLRATPFAASPPIAALWRTPSGGLFYLLHKWVSLSVIRSEFARPMK